MAYNFLKTGSKFKDYPLSAKALNEALAYEASDAFEYTIPDEHQKFANKAFDRAIDVLISTLEQNADKDSVIAASILINKVPKMFHAPAYVAIDYSVKTLDLLTELAMVSVLPVEKPTPCAAQIMAAHKIGTLATTHGEVIKKLSEWDSLSSSDQYATGQSATRHFRAVTQSKGTTTMLVEHCKAPRLVTLLQNTEADLLLALETLMHKSGFTPKNSNNTPKPR